MLSICIPVYNVDVRKLVCDLKKQIDIADVFCQIIVIDDCSRNDIKQINSEIKNDCLYIQLSKNIGRSAIRNSFLNYATCQYLLFLDCDSAIISNDFVEHYLSFIKTNKPNIIVGASIYQTQIPDRSHRLRWYYSINRESKSLIKRLGNHNIGFKTNNFVIDKDTFEGVLFDDRLIGYGHEDTLFGFNLKKKGIQIHHIENPVMNKILDSNESFLSKTEEGIVSLVTILTFDYNILEFINQVRLLSFYKRLFQNRILFILFKLTLPSRKLIESILKRGILSLFLFDLFKLQLLHNEITKRDLIHIIK